MKIDYIVLSYNNSHYKDFYDLNKSLCNKHGWKTLTIEIIDEGQEEVFIDEFGNLHHTFLKYKNSVFESQVSRCFSSSLVNDKNIIFSDIDMLILDKDYIEDIANKHNEDEIIIYSGQPYTDVSFFPTCYILGNSEIMKKLFKSNITFNNFLDNIYNNYSVVWNTDEHYMYDCLKDYEKLVKYKQHNNRLDRSNFNWTSDKKYIDTHLPRPYKQHKQIINKFLKEYGLI